MAASCLEWRERDGLRWLQWECAGVVAAFPTREGGVSPAPFDSLNLGLSTDDAAGNVLENRRRLCAAVGLPQERMVVPGQVHGTTMAWVDDAVAGRGAFSSDEVIAEHDALLTASPSLGLAISYADCVPVVIAAAGPDGPCLATVHAGWRGMIDGIVGQRRGGPRTPRTPRRGRRRPEHRAVLLHRRRRAARALRGAVPRLGRRGDASTSGPALARSFSPPACRPAASPRRASAPPSDARFFSHRRDRGATGRHLALAWRQEA